MTTKYKNAPIHLSYSVPSLENEKYRPWLPSAPPLIEAAGEIVNNLPKPECWTWDYADITDWLTNTIGLPQYKDCFIENYINGRRLLLVDASTCPKIGIRDFSHIQRITRGIREMCNVEMEEALRNISLPPRYPWTHYLLYSVFTGPIRENTTPLRLFRMMGIVPNPDPCPFGHWVTIDPFLPDFPRTRVGRIKRKNVYVKVEPARQPRKHTYYKRAQCKPNYFMRIDLQ